MPAKTHRIGFPNPPSFCDRRNCACADLAVFGVKEFDLEDGP
jgi:hypothetical protein